MGTAILEFCISIAKFVIYIIMHRVCYPWSQKISPVLEIDSISGIALFIIVVDSTKILYHGKS